MVRAIMKAENKMKILWHGTAAIEIRSETTTILFDPFVPLKGSDVPVKLSDYDGFKTVFVTHGHIDHILSLPLISERNPDMKIYCTKAPYQTLERKGIPASRLTRIGYPDSIQIGDIRVRTYHGKHAILPEANWQNITMILRRKPLSNIPLIAVQNMLCQEKDETVFYQIESGGQTISLMGSMNLRDETEYPQGSDYLILPYNGWQDNLTPAIRCIERLRPKHVLLDHYDDTFPPITSAVDTEPICRRYPGIAEEMHYGMIYG